MFIYLLDGRPDVMLDKFPSILKYLMAVLVRTLGGKVIGLTKTACCTEIAEFGMLNR